MIRRIKKSIETEHKINLHCHFTLSEYLALNTTDTYNIIDCKTLQIDRQALVSFIDDYLLKKYTQTIDSKLSLAYGVDKNYSYFDLFSYVLEMNKLVHHSKIYFIKETGFREFYYALKNFNEDSEYKEGVFFELVYKLHKGLIKYRDIYDAVENIIRQEAEFRKNKATLLETMTIPDITDDKFNESIKQAKIIKVPDLNHTLNFHLDQPFDEVHNVKSANVLQANSKLKSTVLGYKEKKGLFGKESYLVEKSPFNGLLYGSRYFADYYLKSLMYQSLFNKKGFVYFNLGPTGIEKYIELFAHTFNVVDEVVYVYYGSKEYTDLDLNAMIRNNKIVIIQLPNTERISEGLINTSFQELDKLITSITIDSSNDYPYSLFVHYTYKYPSSFYASLTKLADLKHLGYSSLVYMPYIDKDPLLLKHFEYIFLCKVEYSEFLVNILENKRINIRDITNLNRYQFFFYVNGTADINLYTSLSFI